MKTFITPDMAKDWLGSNTRNRSIKRTRYELYGSDMLAKRWVYSPLNPIAFDKTGAILDGQHRLLAIIWAYNQDNSFKGMWFDVYRDLPEEVRPVIDIGGKRSVGDTLTIEGHPHGSLATATARLVLNWLDGERIGERRSSPEVHDFILANQEVFNYARLARAVGTAARPAVIGAVLFLATRAKDSDGAPLLEEHAKAFAGGVANGADLHHEDARLALRDAIFRSRSAKGGYAKPGWAFAATVLAWNAFTTGRPMSSISVRQDQSGEFALPMIIGAPARGAGVDNLERATVAASVAAVTQRTRPATRISAESAVS